MEFKTRAVYLRLAGAIAILLACGSAALAQTADTGAITGKVYDQSGAVVAKATAVVTNTATNQSRQVPTSADGVFRVPLLPPGVYSVSVQAEGFEKETVAELHVIVSETATLEFRLKVGNVSVEVQVSSAAPLLQTESAALGNVTSDKDIVSLPLANRNFTQILGLSPGVVVGLPDAGELGRNNQNVASNGGRTTDNNFEFNGVDANNISENSASGFGPEVGLAIPAPDTIQEFKVQTGLYDAGSGRSGGANIDIVSKSGTNDYHGDLFEFFRNNALNANDFFLNKNDQPRPVLKQNQFGLTFGGPIRKDKTFFFIGYQTTIQRNGESVLALQSANLPPLTNDRSAATLGAEFGGETGLFGGVAVAPDGSNINPVALALLNFKFANGQYAIPTPQTISNGVGQFTYSAPAHYEENQFTLNMDHTLNSKNQIAGRFFLSSAPQTTPFALYGANLPGWGQNESDRNLMLSVSDTQTIRTDLINVARFGFVRFYGNRTINEPITNADVGITSPLGLPGIPTIIVNGLFNIGTPASPQFREATNDFIGSDTLSLVSGKHSFRMGVEAKRNQLNTFLPFETRGYLELGSFADFLLGESAAQNGSPYSNIEASNIYSGNFDKAERYIDFNAFFQDDYKVNSRLTLNLGLRWDFFGPPSDVRGRLANFDQRFADPAPPPEGTLTGLVLASNYGGPLPAGVVKSDAPGLYNRSFRDFEPRAGLAYRLSDRPAIVLRAGYGIYFSRPGGQFALQTLTDLPFVLSYSAGGSGNAAATLEEPINPPVPPPSSFPQFIPRFQDSSVTEAGIQQNLHTPYTQQYSVNVQYEFAPNFLLTVGYVGSKGTHIPAGIDYNQAELASPANPINGVTTNLIENEAQRVPYLGISPFSYQAENELNSNYNSLQTSVERRFSHGLTFLASYTFSKNLDYSSGAANIDSLELSSITGDQTNYRQARGPDSFDRTHRFVFNFVYQPPALTHGPGAMRYALSGWQFSGVMVLQSGLPITVVDSLSGTIYGPQTYEYVRPDCVSNQYATSGSVEQRLGGWINPNAFQTAPAIGDGTGFGNCGVGILRGPDQRNIDLGIQRDFKIRESKTLEFRSEFFNFTNTPKFGLPLSDDIQAAGAFGVIASSVSNPRIIQFALKLLF